MWLNSNAYAQSSASQVKKLLKTQAPTNRSTHPVERLIGREATPGWDIALRDMIIQACARYAKTFTDKRIDISASSRKRLIHPSLS